MVYGFRSRGLKDYRVRGIKRERRWLTLLVKNGMNNTKIFNLRKFTKRE